MFGRQGENCGQYLRRAARWRSTAASTGANTKQEGQKRQSVDIIAENVQFLGGREDAGNGNGNGFSSSVRAAESDVPTDTGDFEPAPVAAGVSDDDIPF